MKKIYTLLTLLGLFFFAVPATAQDEEVRIPISMASGDWKAWNGSAITPWARSWYSSSTPAVSVCSKNGGNATTDIRGNDFSGANNMSTWGSNKTDIMFFSRYGNSDAIYEVMVEKGWYIAGVEFDFNCANDKDANDGSIGVTMDANDEVVSTAKDDNQHIEWSNDDDGVYAVQFVVSRKEGTYNFARTSNFYVVVKPGDPVNAICDEIDVIFTEWFVTVEQLVNAGCEQGPGNYSEETLKAFLAVLDDYNKNQTAISTVDEANQYKEKVEAALKAMQDSRNTTMSLADGYYRFRTAINYNDGNAKYMYVDASLSGKWGTREDLDNDCLSLFQVTNKDGNFDVVSMSTDARFGAGGYAQLSAESTEVLAMTPLMTVAGETYVQLRAASLETGTIYIHQASHGSGAGTGGNLTNWYATYPTTLSNKMGASEWVVEPVDAEKAASIIQAYEATKMREKMIQSYKQMLADSKENLQIAKDDPTITVDDKGGLITSVEQLSSPWTDTTEGTDIGVLLPDPDKSWDEQDLGSFWHSNWHNGSVPVHTHYINVALNAPTHELVSLYIRRRQTTSNHTTAWSVYGSLTPDTYYTAEDEEAGTIPEGKAVGDVKVAGEWHKLAELSTPYSGNQKEIVTTLPFDTKAYPYLRFYIDGNTGGSGLCHLSQFQLYPATVEIADNAQYKVMGELAANLEKVIDDQIEVETDALTEEQYNALKTAYDAFMAKFVDPAPLRAAIQTAEASTAGIVVGTNPGEWGADTDAGTLATTVANAKAYDKSGDYTATQSEAYIENLTTLSGDVLTSANKIQEGKWYRIHFGSRDVFEANEWDLTSNDASMVKDINEEETMTNEALWDKYITIAKLVQKTASITVAGDNDEEGNPTTEQQDITINHIQPLDEDAIILRGAKLYYDADEEIADKDLSLFRFIGVGDSAYVLQNKATGLFISAYNGVSLDVMPSLFNVTPLGYGQNLIAASNLITGASLDNLHAQRAQNVVVTWSENTAGSRSGLYIEEAGDVDPNYDGTLFSMSIKPGAIASYCYPVGLATVLDEEVADEKLEMYDVYSVEDGKITLNVIEEAAPGRPFIIINNGTYDAEADDAVPVPFKHGYEFTDKAGASSLLKGTYSTIASLPKGAIKPEATGFVISKSAVMSLISVPAYTAYIQSNDEAGFDTSVDYTYEIDYDAEDGIAATLQKVANNGDIYTLDGRLVTRNGNLNSLRRYGKGLYIVNGVKVVVK